MTNHLFGAIETSPGVEANNRGENEGNMTTLQKILWQGEVHSTVSSESIRWAMRLGWQNRGLDVNRNWNEITRKHEWEDAGFAKGGEPFIDDDVLGYMSAEAAKEEVNVEAENGAPPARGKKPRGTATIRRSRFEVARALSVTPWNGDVIFNVASIGATPSASKTGRDPVPYSGEVHATRYQYGFALTPEQLLQPDRALAVVDAVVDLAEVAGNHARFLFDFSPDTLIFRWTDDAAPRILYPFRLDGNGQLTVPELIRRIRAKDILASELIIGGSLAETADGETLRSLGATVFSGVKEAAATVKGLLTKAGK